MDIKMLIDVNIIRDFIKILFITIFTLRFNYKLMDIKVVGKSKVLYFFILVVIDSIVIIIKNIAGTTIQVISLIIIIALIFSKKINRNIGYSIMITAISFSINYILYLISVIISFCIFNFIHISANVYIILTSILVIYGISSKLVCNIRKLNKGIMFFKKNEQNEYLGLLILNIATALIFSLAILSNIKTNIVVARTLFIYIVFFSIIMFMTIQKSLQLYYKQKLQEREVEEIKEELKNKDKEIEELEKENLKLNKKNHSIAHKQKSLEYELEQMILNNQIVNGNQVKDKIENLSKEMQDETVSIELTKTNIDEIDSMLKYMQSECIKNKIEFELQINGNIHHMVNTYIGKEDLEILIADLIKNAIIAIKHSENINKSILVRLGLIDGFYSLYVYDSGIEFEIETLKNFGIKPSTTHADDGGTGMGLMNIFDTLKKSKASLIIDEYGKPVEDNFTKVIKIIFDNRNEYKIESYRKEEIQEKDINKRIFQDKF